MLGVISLSSVDFDVNSRKATSPESTDLTVRNATGNIFKTHDFRLITLSNQDFHLLTSNDEFNITDSRAMTFDDSVSAIRFDTRDSKLST
ncbi:hypothetical protein Saga11_32650 [Bacillus safensis]|nr:hypothetical protein Saga11_32650 [Bacillus safensis]